MEVVFCIVLYSGENVRISHEKRKTCGTVCRNVLAPWLLCVIWRMVDGDTRERTEMCSFCRFVIDSDVGLWFLRSSYKGFGSFYVFCRFPVQQERLGR